MAIVALIRLAIDGTSNVMNIFFKIRKIAIKLSALSTNVRATPQQLNLGSNFFFALPILMIVGLAHQGKMMKVRTSYASQMMNSRYISVRLIIRTYYTGIIRRKRIGSLSQFYLSLIKEKESIIMSH